MSTGILGSYTPFECSTITQSVTRISNSSNVSPIILTTFSNYSVIYSISFEIVSSAPETISIGTSIPGITLTRVGNIITATSNNVINGVRINNWPYFKLFLKDIKVLTTGALWPNPACTINVSVFDGSTTVNGVFNISELVASTPTTPTLVSVSRTGKEAVTLSWSASTQSFGPGIQGYYIYKNGSGTPLATVTSGLTYIDTAAGVSSNTYAVRSYDGSIVVLTSSLSDSIASTTSSLTAPVASISRTGLSTQTISLTASTSTWGTWSNTYDIYRDSVFLTTATGLTYVDSSAGTGLRSYYAIANDAAGTPVTSTASNTVNGVASQITTPASITATITSRTSVQVNWSASTANYPSAAITYELSRNGSVINTGSALLFNDTTFNNLIDNTYSVRAYQSTVTSLSTSTVYPKLTKYISIGEYYYYSADGITWLQGASTVENNPILTSDSWVSGNAYSYDGITWVGPGPGGSGISGSDGINITTPANNGTVTVVQTGVGVKYSTDNINWLTSATGPTTGAGGASSNPILRIGSGNGKFIQFPNETSTANIWTSVDGNIWSTVGISATAGGQFRRPVYDGIGRWVCLATNMKGMTSTNNGTTWTEFSWPLTAHQAGASSVLYENLSYVNGTWVAVGTYSGKVSIIKSTDGTTWTAVEIPGASNARGNVVYFSGKYITLSDFGTNVYSSTDLIIWTSSPSGLNSGLSSQQTNVITNTGSELFATRWGNSGSSQNIWRSTNGTNWEPVTSFTDKRVGRTVKYG